MGSSKYFTAGAVSIHDLDDNDDDEDDRLKVCNEHQKPFLNTSKMEQAKNDNPKIEWNVWKSTQTKVNMIVTNRFQVKFLYLWWLHRKPLNS